MKKPDLIKQLANRINQPHVIESWIDKIEKSAYKKGFEDAQSKQCNIANVVKSLPTDECVEQWWAEGQDQKEVFWQKAPYRTNGDVVEEIKTALKYFIETWQR